MTRTCFFFFFLLGGGEKEKEKEVPQDLLSLMISRPRLRTAGGLRVAPVKVAASKPQRRVTVNGPAIFVGIGEQQETREGTWGEHRRRSLLAGQRGQGQAHHAW